MNVTLITNPIKFPKFLEFKEFGDFFFDGKEIYFNTGFTPDYSYGDNYAEIPDVYSSAFKLGKELHKHKVTSITFKEQSGSKNVDQQFILGLHQGQWEFVKDFKFPELFQIKNTVLDDKEYKEVESLSQAMFYSRNFLMLPPNYYSEDLKEIIQKRFKSYKNVTTKVFDEKQMAKMGLNGCLDVNRGAKKPPYFIEITIPAKKKMTKRVCLVGKCLYDIGGLAIKDAQGQTEMYIDKGGASTTLGIADYLAQHPLDETEVVVMIAAVRNEVSDTSYYNGEVIKVGSADKNLSKDVLIANTDAEGRITLADKLVYAQKNYPGSLLIDVATLTGASIRSHGNDCGSVFVNDKALKDQLEVIFASQSEIAEVFPYRKRLGEWFKVEEKTADLRNIPNYPEATFAGHQTAAEFLRTFVKDHKHVHLDLAGPVIDKKGNATGYGIRSLIQFLKGV
jgi:leucyl aminopeptidase